MNGLPSVLCVDGSGRTALCTRAGLTMSAPKFETTLDCFHPSAEQDQTEQAPILQNQREGAGFGEKLYGDD